MKKIVYLLLAIAFVLPFAVFAEGEESREVKVYFFHGDGCPHCAEAEEYFQGIEAEYGDKFEIVSYEVWNDSNNAALMEKVGKARNEEIGGVPYIVIGNKSWAGFTEQWGKEMLAEINSLYEVEVADRYDIMQLVETGSTATEKTSVGSDIVSLIVILLIAGGIGFGIYKSRQAVNE